MKSKTENEIYCGGVVGTESSLPAGLAVGIPSVHISSITPNFTSRNRQDSQSGITALPLRVPLAWAVADEEAVVLVELEWLVPGHQVHPGPAPQQASQLVVLEAAVHGADIGGATSVVRDSLLRGESG